MPNLSFNRSLVTTLLGAAVALLIAVAPGGHAVAGGTPKCHGKPATINNTDTLAIRGTQGPDVIVAGPGEHQIEGLGGDDVICSGPGLDVIAGGQGDDLLDAASGNDLLYGNGGDDALLGRTGDDLLDGKSGTDRCVGGPGADTASVTRCERITGADGL